MDFQNVYGMCNPTLGSRRTLVPGLELGWVGLPGLEGGWVILYKTAVGDGRKWGMWVRPVLMVEMVIRISGLAAGSWWGLALWLSNKRPRMCQGTAFIFQGRVLFRQACVSICNAVAGPSQVMNFHLLLNSQFGRGCMIFRFFRGIPAHLNWLLTSSISLNTGIFLMYIVHILVFADCAPNDCCPYFLDLNHYLFHRCRALLT